jgi:hypothetical protein
MVSFIDSGVTVIPIPQPPFPIFAVAKPVILPFRIQLAQQQVESKGSKRTQGRVPLPPISTIIEGNFIVAIHLIDLEGLLDVLG